MSGRIRSDVFIPVAVSEWAVLTGAFPMTIGEWDQMMGVLDAMKPGLVDLYEGAPTIPAPDEERA